MFHFVQHDKTEYCAKPAKEGFMGRLSRLLTNSFKFNGLSRRAGRTCLPKAGNLEAQVKQVFNLLGLCPVEKSAYFNA